MNQAIVHLENIEFLEFWDLFSKPGIPWKIEGFFHRNLEIFPPSPSLSSLSRPWLIVRAGVALRRAVLGCDYTLRVNQTQILTHLGSDISLYMYNITTSLLQVQPGPQSVQTSQPQFSLQTAVVPQSVNSQDSGTQTQHDLSSVSPSTTTPPSPTTTTNQDQLATQASQSILLSSQGQNSLLLQGQGQGQVLLQSQGQVIAGQLAQQPLQQVLAGKGVCRWTWCPHVVRQYILRGRGWLNVLMWLDNISTLGEGLIECPHVVRQYILWGGGGWLNVLMWLDNIYFEGGVDWMSSCG